MKMSVAAMLGGLMIAGLQGQARGDVYQGSPKLVVVLVIDQFRGDYLGAVSGGL